MLRSTRSGSAASRVRGSRATYESVTHQPADQARGERDAERRAVQQRRQHQADDAAGELVHAHPRRRAPDALGLDVVADDPLIRSARDVHPELQQQRRGPQPAERRCERQRDDPRYRERDAERGRTAAGGRRARGGDRTRNPAATCTTAATHAPTAASSAYELTACGASAETRSCSTTPSTAVHTTWIPNQNVPRAEMRACVPVVVERVDVVGRGRDRSRAARRPRRRAGGARRLRDPRWSAASSRSASTAPARAAAPAAAGSCARRRAWSRTRAPARPPPARSRTRCRWRRARRRARRCARRAPGKRASYASTAASAIVSAKSLLRAIRSRRPAALANGMSDVRYTKRSPGHASSARSTFVPPSSAASITRTSRPARCARTSAPPITATPSIPAPSHASSTTSSVAHQASRTKRLGPSVFGLSGARALTRVPIASANSPSTRPPAVITARIAAPFCAAVADTAKGGVGLPVPPPYHPGQCHGVPSW